MNQWIIQNEYIPGHWLQEDWLIRHIHYLCSLSLLLYLHANDLVFPLSLSRILHYKQRAKCKTIKENLCAPFIKSGPEKLKETATGRLISFSPSHWNFNKF